MIALLSALVTSRADSIVATMPSGAKPEASVTLTFDEGKQERVTFYRAGDEVYASRDGVLAKIQGDRPRRHPEGAAAVMTRIGRAASRLIAAAALAATLGCSAHAAPQAGPPPPTRSPSRPSANFSPS